MLRDCELSAVEAAAGYQYWNNLIASNTVGKYNLKAGAEYIWNPFFELDLRLSSESPFGLRLQTNALKS